MKLYFPINMIFDIEGYFMSFLRKNYQINEMKNMILQINNKSSKELKSQIF